MKQVLVLGAGLVARPLVRYLADLEDCRVTVASRTLSRAEALVRGHTSARAYPLDVKNLAKLEELVRTHDVVVSLLPAPKHPIVARLCLQHGKHLTTTSYISAEMAALDSHARAEGLTFLNECGLDPGIDHMSAMHVIDSARAKGGRVLSFRSWCGGLPAPEANTNPLGYKFSWSPRSVLVAATNAARYRSDGKEIEVPGGELFARPALVDVPGVGRLEGYPNRDSLSYEKMYGLEAAATLFRGTLRNIGHCETFYPWVKLGLLDQTPRSDLAGRTYRGFMQSVAGGSGDVVARTAERMGLGRDTAAIVKLEWLGMFEDEPLPITDGANVDVLTARMSQRCAFAPGERDMIVLQHEFVVENDERTDVIRSSLVAYGIPDGDSAMARTVSLPVAIATRLILEDRIVERGVFAPVRPAVYQPILDELAAQGIRCEERVLRSQPPAAAR